MKTLEIAIGTAVEKLRELEWRRERFAEIIKNNRSNILLDGKPLFREVSPASVNGKIAAVDGGLLHRNLHGFDLVLGKALGAIFEYKDTNLLNAEYYPDPFPTPTPYPIYKPLSSRDSEIMAQILRQGLEIHTAQEIAQNYDIHTLLLDGSIIPHSSSRPYDDSEIKEEFAKLLESYKNLFKTCQEKNIQLAGIVEDSRGRRFGDILSKTLTEDMQDEDLLSTTNDTNLLYYMLNKSERTADFPFSDHTKKHPILRGLGEWAKSVRTFYLRPTTMDRPLRIDFLSSTTEPTKLASELLPICSANELYGIPTPIIEADARAHLSQNEIDMVYNQLMDRTGPIPSIMKLRRDMRPF